MFEGLPEFEELEKVRSRVSALQRVQFFIDERLEELEKKFVDEVMKEHREEILEHIDVSSLGALREVIKRQSKLFYEVKNILNYDGNTIEVVKDKDATKALITKMQEEYKKKVEGSTEYQRALKIYDSISDELVELFQKEDEIISAILKKAL